MTSTVQTAEVIYRGGSILTMDDHVPVAEALAVAGGQIIAVGSEDVVSSLRGDETRMVDLKGATLMPGFIDSHSHLVFTSRKLAAVDMDPPPAGSISSITDIQHAMRARLAAEPYGPDRWLIGWGYDHSMLAERRHPDRHDLDAVSTAVPIYLNHFSAAHQVVVNSRALALLGISANSIDPEGGVIKRESGSHEPNGLLEESAAVTANLAAMRSLMQHADMATLIDNAINAYAAKGFTTATECLATPHDVHVLRKMAASDRLKLDVIAFMPYGSTTPEEVVELYSREYQSRFRVGGYKMMLDGGSPGRTAYLREPYYQQLPGENGYRSYARIAQHTTNDLVVRCFQHDLPLVIHALGDASLDQCIAALNVGQYVAPGDNRRTQLIHLQQVQEDQFDRLRDLDVTLTFQVAHNFYFGDFHEQHIYGPARTARLNPVVSALERGLSVSIHHDSPVHSVDQLFLIWTAVNRVTRTGRTIGAAQRMPVIDALKASTINAAYQFFEEDRKGSLVPGKFADLVVLDRNPLQIPPLEIKDIRVLETIKEGRTIYKTV